MITLVCPHCLKSVSVADAAAGTTAPCPSCGKDFPVPARYTPVVADDRPPAPPPAVPDPAPPAGYVPPAAAPLEAPPPPEPAVPGVPAGYTRSVGFGLSPKVLAWVPAVCLSLVLVLTLFQWVGSHVGGYTVYSQNAWRSLTGGSGPYNPLQAQLKKLAPWTADVANKVPSDWPLMLPFLVCLLLALVVAWAERAVAAVDRRKLPPSLEWVAAVWPYRIPLLAGLATAALLLLLIQTASGFGLERAMRRAVAEQSAEARQKNAGNAAALDEIEFNDDLELARVNLERTTWLYLVILLHLVVVLAMVGRAGLERRGDKPPPRVVVQY